MPNKFNTLPPEELDKMFDKIEHAFNRFESFYEELMTYTRDVNDEATEEDFRELEAHFITMLHAIKVFDREVFG